LVSSSLLFLSGLLTDYKCSIVAFLSRPRFIEF
jgi:hypothetical protein